VLNELVKYVEDLVNGDQLPEVKLKEFVGHTPIQVLAGMTLGIINAVLMYHFIF
jgi:acid phosphatase family membrane protein YuiD